MIRTTPAPLQSGGVARTADYYISTTGSDSNPGTLVSPWAITSLQAGNAHQSTIAGKRVGLLDGTYSVLPYVVTDYQHHAFNVPAGSAGHPTTILAVNLQKAILDWGNGATSTDGGVIGQDIGGTGSWALDGLVVKGYSASTTSCKWISYFPGTETGPAVIQNCEFYGMTSSAGGSNDGIFFQGAVNAVLKNNYFHDIRKPTQQDHVHPFVEYSSNGTQITYNTCINCDSGIDGKVGAVASMLAYNYFYNCPNPVQGYDGAEGNPNGTFPSDTNIAHHNVFDACGSSSHQCDVNNTTSQALTWYNNTTYDSRSGSNVSVDLRCSTASLITCYNNVLVAPSNSGGDSYGSSAFSTGGLILLDYNAYFLNNYSGGWGLTGTTYTTLGAWQTASSSDAHSGVANPNFISAITSGNGSAQFKLNQSTSPYRSSGGTPGRVGGVVSGATQDMGAWGYDPALGGAPARIGCDHDGLANT